MDDQPAPRGADESGFLNAECGQPGKDIAGLDADIIVADIGIVGRLPASAIVEGNHLARYRGSRRKLKRQFVKVPRVAGQPGQADDRPVPGLRVAIDPRMAVSAAFR